MNNVQFKEALRRGLGSAFIELKACNSREKYKDVVLWCCLHNTCYDSQSEGNRGKYLYDAISLFDDKSFFEEAIINKFTKKNLESCLFEWLCSLLFQFAKGGSLRARTVLYEKYDALFKLLTNSKRINNTLFLKNTEFEWLCIWLISLDGFRAFKGIVDRVGNYYISAKDTKNIDLEWFYTSAKDQFGEVRVDKYLKNDSAKNKAVSAFLKEIESINRNEPYQPDAAPSLKEYIDACRETSGYRCRGIALRFARTASMEDLTELARVVIQETNLKIKLELLWPFRKKPFPLDESSIFELTKSNDKAIRDIAFEIMQNTPSDRVHEYAVMLLREKKEIVNALSLICSCYKSTDEELLLEGIKSLAVTNSSSEWHGVFMNVENLLDRHSYRFGLSLFENVYRQTMCSYCRANLVQKMFKRKILPIEILEECLYDSYEDTRKFSARKLRNKIYRK